MANSLVTILQGLDVLDFICLLCLYLIVYLYLVVIYEVFCCVIILLDSTGMNCTKLNKYKVIMTLE